ncbi:hypothetical protein [Candidatus Protochlamydia phocaeensis]|uniref:hypothetical protein n=1 Tax=Candidatus Protochlamydia phocaeensis TaxID=1414722 RepID=UPI0008386A17|nr:hypothetical protein [Candidatus Protochlamydia phocaeensis]
MVKITDLTPVDTNLTVASEETTQSHTTVSGRSYSTFASDMSDQARKFKERIANHAFFNSLCWEAAKNTGLEMTGASLGGSLAAAMGPHLYPDVPLAALAATVCWLTDESSQTVRKTDQAAKLIFCSLTFTLIGLVLTSGFSELAPEESEGLATVWTTFFGMIGSLIGGYLFSSEQVFYDSSQPEESYSIKVGKYLIAGEMAQKILARPPASPIYYPLRLARTTAVLSSQLMAYYSPLLIKTAEELRQHKSKTILTHLLKHVIAERCGGQHSTRIARDISELIVGPLNEFSRYLSTELNLGNQSRNALNAVIETGLNQILNPDYTPNFVLRSFVSYSKIIKTEEIQKASRHFELSFGDEEERKKSKETLITCIRNRIQNLFPAENLTDKIADFVLTAFLDEQKSKTLAALLIQKIKEAELRLTGFPLLSEHHAGFIQDMLDIHIQNYLIFALSRHQSFSKALTLMDEEQLLLDIQQGFFSLYCKKVVPSFLADKVQKVTGFGIKALFSTKKALRIKSQQVLTRFAPSMIQSGYFSPPVSNSGQLPLYLNLASLENPLYFEEEPQAKDTSGNDMSTFSQSAVPPARSSPPLSSPGMQEMQSLQKAGNEAFLEDAEQKIGGVLIKAEYFFEDL